MQNVNVKSLKNEVVGLWKHGERQQAIDSLEKRIDLDDLSSAMDKQQLSYTDDVIMGLGLKVKEEAKAMDEFKPDTRPLHDLLSKIDEVSATANEKDVPVWDVSLCVDDARPADDEEIDDLIDVATKEQ